MMATNTKTYYQGQEVKIVNSVGKNRHIIPISGTWAVGTIYNGQPITGLTKGIEVLATELRSE